MATVDKFSPNCKRVKTKEEEEGEDEGPAFAGPALEKTGKSAIASLMLNVFVTFFRRIFSELQGCAASRFRLPPQHRRLGRRGWSRLRVDGYGLQAVASRNNYSWDSFCAE